MWAELIVTLKIIVTMWRAHTALVWARGGAINRRHYSRICKSRSIGHFPELESVANHVYHFLTTLLRSNVRRMPEQEISP